MQDLIVEIREKCKLRNGFVIWHLSFMFGTTGKAVQLAKKVSQQLVAWAWFPVRTYRRHEKWNMRLVQPFSWIQSPICKWKVLALCYQCSYQCESSHGASSTKKRGWVLLITDTPHRVREQKWTWCFILCDMQYVFGVDWKNQQFTLVQRFPPLWVQLPIRRGTFKVSNRREMYIYLRIVYFQIFIHISMNVLFKNNNVLVFKNIYD